MSTGQKLAIPKFTSCICSLDTVDEFKESICSLCGGTVMHPSALSCPHFYCNNCLEKYCTEVVEQVEVNEFLCPLCRVSFDLKPGEKVADFPSDKFTNHLLGLMAHHYCKCCFFLTYYFKR